MKIDITSSISQQIVDKVMETIPYNVNIMNKEGVIIASGHRNRIGTIHQGALKAIKINGINEIFENTSTEKQGVNIPFYYEQQLVGVIGISGNPERVRPFARLVSITAEFMINQQVTLSQEGQRELQLNALLNDFAYNYNECDHPFFKERAQALGFRLDIPRVCIAIKTDKLSNALLSMVAGYLFENEYSLRYKANYCLCYMTDSSKLPARLANMANSIASIRYIGVGSSTNILAQSVDEAIKATELASQLRFPETICWYEHFRLCDILLTSQKADKLTTPIDRLCAEGGSADLLKTLQIYFAYNGEINTVADSLHIHRNTLYYRLSKITDITHKDPAQYRDLFELYIAYLAHSLLHTDPHSAV